jgi:hypothetical protein
MPKKNRSQGDSSDGSDKRRPTQDEMIAAGKIPFNNPQGGTPDPGKIQKVQIVGDDFFEQLKNFVGGGQSGGGQAGGKNQFDAIIQSQKAMTQAAHDITQEMKATAAMIRDLQSSSATMMTQMSGQFAQQRQQDRDQMTQLIQVLTMNGGLGGGGTGGGSGGHGGGGHGGMGYNPQNGSYQSYGSLGQRMRAGAANYLANTHGTAGLPKGATNPGRLRKAAAVTNIAGGLAQGGVGSALSRVPYVGAAIAAGESVNKAATWLTDQRAANAPYQSIYGGGNTGMASETDVPGLFGDLGQFFSGGDSNSTTGLGNRMAEEGFSLGQRFTGGGMNDADSRALFQGVSALGYTGDRRSGALNFATGNYQSLGMNQQQSMQLITLSAQHAQGSLAGLATQLQNVTKAAQQTGLSAQSVQAAFTQNYAQALQSGMGQGAGQIASAATNVAAAGGRATTSSNQLSALNNPAMLYMAASQQGMTPGQLEAGSQGNPALMTGALGATTQKMMQSYLGSGTMGSLSQLIQQNGGGAAVSKSPGLQMEVGRQLMQTGGYNVTAVRAMMQYVDPGMANASDDQIAAWIANQGAGNNLSSQAANMTAANKPQAVGQQEFQSKKAPDINDGGVKGVGFSNYAWNMKQQGEKDYSAAGFWSNLFGGSQSDAAVTRQTNATYYNTYEKNNKKNNPVIEKLLNQYGNDPNIRFKVKTKDGDKAVTFGEAIQNFSDQLSSGTAQIVSSNGDLNGQSVGSIAGTVAGTKVTSTSSSWSGSDYGTVAGEIGATNTDTGQGGSQADNNAASSGTGGTISVSLSPEAQKLFTFSTSGAVSLNSSASAGVPADQSTGPK